MLHSTRLSCLLLAALLPFPALSQASETSANEPPSQKSSPSIAPDPIVAQRLEAKKTPYKVDQDGDYRIVVKLEDGRSQVVWVRSEVNSTDFQNIREIWTYALRSEERRLPVHIANQLLSDSFKLKLGAWVRDGGDALLVIKIAADASADVLDEAIDIAAYSGDRMEQKLVSGDEL